MGIPGNRFGSDQVLPGKGLPKRQKKLLYERPGLAKKWRGKGERKFGGCLAWSLRIFEKPPERPKGIDKFERYSCKAFLTKG
jgi:hypothetical protein